MSLDIADMIKTPFEQLSEEIRTKVVDFYMGEEKADLIEMHLHSLNAQDLIVTLESMEEYLTEEGA